MIPSVPNLLLFSRSGYSVPNFLLYYQNYQYLVIQGWFPLFISTLFFMSSQYPVIQLLFPVFPISCDHVRFLVFTISCYSGLVPSFSNLLLFRANSKFSKHLVIKSEFQCSQFLLFRSGSQCSQVLVIIQVRFPVFPTAFPFSNNCSCLSGQ